jgi:uncharacterized glyoxalase superfamily protein PhnB
MPVVPHFTARDVERAVAFYRDACGGPSKSRRQQYDGAIETVSQVA